MSQPQNRVQGAANAINIVRETLVETAHGTKRALITEPTGPIHVDRPRLARIRSGDGTNEVDEAMVRVAESRPDIDAIVFRAHRGAGERCWGYSPELSDDEVDVLGEAMVRLQMDLYRKLANRDVFALAGTEFGEREYQSFRRGTERVAAELERAIRDADDAAAAQHRFDLWLLDHFAMWVTADLDEFLVGGLPRLLEKVERRRRQLEEMRAALATAV